MSLKVTSVLGELEAQDLGATLTHEHFSLNVVNEFFREPPAHLKQFFGPKITLDTVGYVRQYPYGSRSNITFFGKEVDQAVMKEMHLFKSFGGGTVVENTSHGIERNLDLSYRVAKETGVNVIAGTGHYVNGTQNSGTLSMTVEEISDLYRKDLTIGHSVPSAPNAVKCGVIAEVGSSWPITEFEKRSIQATAIVQSELGCPVSFHPGRHRGAPFEIIRIYAEAGGKIDKADLSHLDRTLQVIEDLLDFAELGTYCQFDLFGTEVSYYMLAPEIDFPSDAVRVDRIKRLVDDGFGDKVLVSHDIHTKHRLVEFGGHGYSHLLNNVRPQMANKGISEDAINKIFVDNPARWLCH
ncbi:hypothetical protein GE061_003496 [Apolygus lucorum]|uniref:Uncharacterized protein n=1 Tax=Apolygus lucorum TaxID=248454 RepID=A0A6A4JMF8_APOLU|nr:hypothetical protein GE061_003496 [Apolygus lucorum]